MMKFILDIGSITRIRSSLFCGLAVWLLSDMAMHAFSVVCFLAFSFAFNDLVDRGMDKDGHPERPLAAGRLQFVHVIILCVSLAVLGLFVAYIYSNSIVWILFCYIGSIIYSWFLKRHVPIVSNLLWVTVVTVAVFYPISLDLIYYVFFWCVLYSHELVLDYRDRHSDSKHCTTPTIPVIFGDLTILLIIGIAIALIVFSFVVSQPAIASLLLVGLLGLLIVCLLFGIEGAFYIFGKFRLFPCYYWVFLIWFFQ